MTPLRALLVDDERLARKRLAELLAPYHADIVVAGEAEGVESAALMAANLLPDVVFLDLEMPPEHGLDLLPRLPESPAPPAVVFVTAYETFAVQAFTLNALDYLLKPVHPDRLALTLGRLRATRLGSPAAAANTAGATEEIWTMESRVTLGDRQTLQSLRVSEIVAIHALGAYSRVCLPGQPAITVLRSISEWERRLPPGGFARIDRSLIVNVHLLRRMEKKSRDEMVVTLEGLPEQLTVGRTAAVRLRRQLDGVGSSKAPRTAAHEQKARARGIDGAGATRRAEAGRDAQTGGSGTGAHA